MGEWSKLSPDLKMCVIIYNERQSGRDVWASRLCELLKGELSRRDISKNEDRLMDLGILNMQYRKVDGLWTCCYNIEPEVESFIANLAANIKIR
jgi:hypothetical protein